MSTGTPSADRQITTYSLFVLTCAPIPDDVPILTLAQPEWDLLKLAVGGYAESVNYHSQCATSDGQRQMLWLVAQLHRLSAKLHEATGRPAAYEVLELHAADTLAEADAVRIAAE